MNFGPIFKQWIELIYDHQEAEIYMALENSSPFEIHRAVRQGCPLSPLIVNLFLEILTEVVRQNPNIKGINYLDKPHKILLYADDTVFSLSDLYGNLD